MLEEPTGPDQEFISAIVADLATALSEPTTAVSVERVERVTWPDGSLGCPEPGELYSQAVVDGFRVILRAAGRPYDYRVGRGGAFRRCEQGVDASQLRPWDQGCQ